MSAIVSFGGATMSGGNFTLTGVVLPEPVAVQQPGAPALTARRLNGQVVVSWPGAADVFTLEFTDNLTERTQWQPVIATPGRVDDQNVVTLSATAIRRFFRLKQRQ